MATTTQQTTSYTPSEYANYVFSASDTFESVAAKFNTTASNLAKINNITGNLPKYISEVPALQASASIRVPLLGNGGTSSTPNYYYYENTPKTTASTYAYQSAGLSGTGGSVIIVVGGVVLNMPCYPKSLSDSVQSSYGGESLFTSTEPYKVYNNAGPRTVNVSFQFHREMRGYDNDSYIDTIINTLQAACYPINDGTMGVEVKMSIGSHFYIRGIIEGNVTVTPSGPIIDGKYNVIDVSFTITEITGNNMSFATKRSYGTLVGA